MITAVQIKEDRDTAEQWLLNTEEKKDALIYVRNTQDKQKQTKWIDTIDDAVNVLPEHHRAFIMFRRKAERISFDNRGKPAWFDYVQARYAEWYYNTYGKASVPSKRCFQAWWSNAVNIVVIAAIREGLL